MLQAEGASADPLLAYDRESGKLTGAGIIDRIAVLALQAGSTLTRPFGHRGYGLGCEAVSAAVSARDIIVRLNPDAVFAMPFADGYWSRLLNSEYDYEEEIEAFLKSIADVRYVFVDCGANFGYWSVLVSSKPFGAQTAWAIEASPRNAERLELNARLNGNRFPCLNAAVGRTSGGYARITGHKHEALGTVLLADREDDAIRTVSLDSLGSEGLIDPAQPIVVKLDVEGVDAMRGGASLVSGNTIFICEEHGSDRDHVVSQYLMSATPLRVYIFDPQISRFVHVSDAAVLDRVKRYTWVGYNVFATCNPLWEDRILGTRWHPR